MPQQSYRTQLFCAHLLMMLIRSHLLLTGAGDTQILQILTTLQTDLLITLKIQSTCYLADREWVPKSGSIDLVWDYMENPHNHHWFTQMLRVSPQVFHFIYELIHKHPVFHNAAPIPQTPVQIQLAVTLYRMGCFGNGASVEDVAQFAGVSAGSVELFTTRCFTAIMSLHKLFVKLPTPAEKEHEKKWVEREVGFGGLWQEGWVMYDGTIVPLFAKPGLNGDAYFTCKSNYGLNLQIGNVPSNLRIVDYSCGYTGSAHDALAFQSSGAAKYPDWFFQGDEFAWTDSAYAVSDRTIPIHKKPASLLPENSAFDAKVSHLCVRSEHCVGKLKGCFQCLRGLWVVINSNYDHTWACQWISVAIILHNICIYMDEDDSDEETGFWNNDEGIDDDDDNDLEGLEEIEDEGQGSKRRQLVQELLVNSRT